LLHNKPSHFAPELGKPLIALKPVPAIRSVLEGDVLPQIGECVEGANLAGVHPERCSKAMDLRFPTVLVPQLYISMNTAGNHCVDTFFDDHGFHSSGGAGQVDNLFGEVRRSLAQFTTITVRDRLRNAASRSQRWVAGEARIISSSLMNRVAVDFEGGPGHYFVL
jgi:hypothetical protein